MSVTFEEVYVDNNIERKRCWKKRNEPISVTLKDGLHSKKVIFYAWWDWKIFLHYECLPNNGMINVEKYCSQLDASKRVVEQKHSELAFNFPSK